MFPSAWSKVISITLLAATVSATACSDETVSAKDAAAGADDADAATAPHDTSIPADISTSDGQVTADAGPGPCKQDAVCEQRAGTLPPCRRAKCVEGQCKQTVAEDGASCEDGMPCTLQDSCTNGTCVGLAVTATDCDDANPCSTDSCDEGTGLCSHQPVDGGCAHPNPCVGPGTCNEGLCQPGKGTCTCQKDADCLVFGGDPCLGTLVCDKSALPFNCVPDPATAVVCQDASLPCSTTACNPATGKCAASPKKDGLACAAVGDACATFACDKGSCQPAKPLRFAKSTPMGGKGMMWSARKFGTGAVTAGTRYVPGSPNGREGVLARFDHTGSMLWKRVYSATDGFELAFAAPRPSGGFALGAAVGALSSAGARPALLLTDDSGVKQSMVTYTTHIDPSVMILRAGKGYILVGAVHVSKWNTMAWILAVDLEGKVLFEKTYGGKGSDHGAPALNLANNDILFIAHTQAGASQNMRLYRYDQMGKVLVSKTWGSPADDHAGDVVEANDGSFYISGESIKAGGLDPDAWLMHLDKQGEQKWWKFYPAKGQAHVNGLLKDGKDLLLFGRTYGTSGAPADHFVIRTDAAGKALSKHHYVLESGNFVAGFIDRLDDGRLVIPGTVGCSPGSMFGDHHLVYADITGNPACPPCNSGGCEDASPCTIDGCTKDIGCWHTATNSACTAKEPCVDAICENGACKPVGGANCDDKKPCTTDACAAGKCSHAQLANGTSCGGQKVCNEGVCATPCGNGTLDASMGEACDDGNNAAGDGCSPTCHVESGLPSCATITALAAGADDGMYTLDVDASGPIKPLQLQCDISGGGWTLVASMADGPEDDLPGSPTAATKGWSRDGNGKLQVGANKVALATTPADSAAVAMAVVAALAAGGAKQLRVCLQAQTGPAACRTSPSALGLTAGASTNAALAAYKSAPLVYSYGRIIGQPIGHSGASYDVTKLVSGGGCLARKPGKKGFFGAQKGGLCEVAGQQAAVWRAGDDGVALRPWLTAGAEIDGGPGGATRIHVWVR